MNANSCVIFNSQGKQGTLPIATTVLDGHHSMLMCYDGHIYPTMSRLMVHFCSFDQPPHPIAPLTIKPQVPAPLTFLSDAQHTLY